MPFTLKNLPGWLNQSFMIKAGVYAAIGLTLFLWWRAREARIAEENYVKGITGGVTRIEEKLDTRWGAMEDEIQANQEDARKERAAAAEQTAKVNAKIDVMLTNLKKLTAVTLTIDERQKNYEAARTIPPDKLDGALLEITRQIRELESKQQPEPVP